MRGRQLAKLRPSHRSHVLINTDLLREIFRKLIQKYIFQYHQINQENANKNFGRMRDSNDYHHR